MRKYNLMMFSKYIHKLRVNNFLYYLNNLKNSLRNYVSEPKTKYLQNKKYKFMNFHI